MFQKKGEAELYQAQPLEQKLYQPNGAIFWFVSICRQKIQILPTYSGYSAGRICCYLLYYIYIYLYIHLHFWACNQILPAEYCAISCQAQPMEYKLFGPNGAVLGWFDSAGRISKFCGQNIEILPAEYGYSASRIWIFCQQNKDILPTESGYYDSRIFCHLLYHIYIYMHHITQCLKVVCIILLTVSYSYIVTTLIREDIQHNDNI